MKRRETPSQSKPEQLIGKSIRLPDIMRYAREAHEDSGWGPLRRHELQAQENFKFDGRSFRHYVRNVLGKDFNISRIYFPAVYAGKVAKTISDSGYDVHASDLSEYWVQNAIGLGLEAEKRSFEQIPSKGYDAVVSFEPYCVPTPLRYLAVLRSLAAHMPFIEIDQRNTEGRIALLAQKKHFEKYPLSLGSLPESCQNLIQILKKRRIMRLDEDEFAWEAKVYLARTMVHLVHDGNAAYMFRSVVPDMISNEKARMDIALITILEWHTREIEFSLDHFSRLLDATIEKLSGSLHRLKRMVSYLSVESSLYCKDFIVKE